MTWLVRLAKRCASALWARDGRWPRMLLGAAFLLVLGMYCTNQDMGGDPASPRGDGRYRPVLARGDGHMLFLMARSTAFDGDWVFDNDLARFGDPWNEPRTKTGRKSIVHPIGAPLVWTPLLWIAQAGAVVVNVFGADIPLHGYTLWHQRFVFLSSALAACGAVLLGLILARRLLGAKWAPTYAAVAVLLGTPLTYYATFMPSYSHALGALACAAFIAYWALTLGTWSYRRIIILGVLLGVAMLIRVQEVGMGVCVAVEVVAEALRDRRAAVRWLALGALTLAVSLVVFIPQLLEWHVVFGSITELPQGNRYTRLGAPMIGELLFSARNGWFSTTPIAYASVLGLFVLPKRARVVAIGLIACVAVQVYFNSTVIDWWSSASYGQRRMCNVTIALVVGLAALIWRCGALAKRLHPYARHGILLAVLGFFVAWNLGRVFELRGGKPAPSEHAPLCCNRVPGPLRGIASWIYDHVGDPFEFPANAWFAVRHGVDLQRWDRVAGAFYPLDPPWTQLADDQLPRHHGVLHVGAAGIEPLLVGGLSAPANAEGRPVRYTMQPSVTVLVPNLMPYGQRLSLWLYAKQASHATLRWNGDVVDDANLAAGWTKLTFDLEDIALHTNELTIESEVGAGVGDLELVFLPR